MAKTPDNITVNQNRRNLDVRKFVGDYAREKGLTLTGAMEQIIRGYRDKVHKQQK